MTGQLITDSYSGNTQFDDTLFAGNLTPVPVPAAAWLFVGGILGVGTFARKKRTG
jgi:hypothetical protein